MIAPIFTQIQSFLLSNIALSIQSQTPPKYEYLLGQLKGETIAEADWLALTMQEGKQLGFQQWEDDNNLMLIPLYLLHQIPKGMRLATINHKTFEFDPETADNEARYGALAYGLYMDLDYPQLVYNPDMPHLIYVRDTKGNLTLDNEPIVYDTWVEDLIPFPYTSDEEKVTIDTRTLGEG